VEVITYNEYHRCRTENGNILNYSFWNIKFGMLPFICVELGIQFRLIGNLLPSNWEYSFVRFSEICISPFAIGRSAIFNCDVPSFLSPNTQFAMTDVILARDWCRINELEVVEHKAARYLPMRVSGASR
jgi:hypothetical protein